MAAATKTWSGAKALRRFLVPVDDLEPFPGNPRRGDVEAIAGSLNRFGQVKPVVVQGGRIVAGHHVVAAARELGWTHVAVLDHDFADETEARAFLLADNRVAGLGHDDLADLTEHLRMLEELDALEGTGYSAADFDHLMAEFVRMGEQPIVDDETHVVSFNARVRSDKEIVLFYSDAQFEQVETWLRMVGKETGADGVSEQVFEALRIAAAKVNLEA